MCWQFSDYDRIRSGFCESNKNKCSTVNLQVQTQQLSWRGFNMRDTFLRTVILFLLIWCCPHHSVSTLQPSVIVSMSLEISFKEVIIISWEIQFYALIWYKRVHCSMKTKDVRYISVPHRLLPDIKMYCYGLIMGIYLLIYGVFNCACLSLSFCSFICMHSADRFIQTLHSGCLFYHVIPNQTLDQSLAPYCIVCASLIKQHLLLCNYY